MPRRVPVTRAGGVRFAAVLIVIALTGVALLAWMALRERGGPLVQVPAGLLPTTLGHVMGSDSAPVEIVEFGDFECPTCGRFATSIEPAVRARLVETGLARFRFLDFPLQSHPNTLFAHHSAACAGAQGRFWEMHDRLFAGQQEWSGLGAATVPDAEAVMKGYAAALSLDTAQFDACLDGREFAAQIQENRDRGVALRIPGTPTFFVGDAMLPQALPAVETFAAIVDSLARRGGGSGSAAGERRPPDE